MENKLNNLKNLIIVTKENFHECINEFKSKIKNKSLIYVVLNNEISTFNPKYIEKYGEIIFSEFTICYINNEEKNELSYITYLIPSIKYHRFTPEEFASYSSIILNNLSNESDLYTLKYIYSTKSLSYENINEKENLEKIFTSILKEGKNFTEENKKSFNYFPKAIELPSKKFQKRFEDIIKYLIELNYNEKQTLFLEKINNKTIYTYETDLYESNFKLLNRLLNFKWNLIFQNLEDDDYKILINKYKIKILKPGFKFKKDFINFIENLINFFLDKDNIETNFEIDINDKYFNEDLFNNWKNYLEYENKYINFFYKIDKDKIKNKAIFCIKIENNKKNINRYENILKFLKFIIHIKDNSNNNTNEEEFFSGIITFKNFNMSKLFTKRVRKRMEFSYHIIPCIDRSKFKINKTKEYYISKICYKSLLIRNCNDEEILFGKKIRNNLEQLFDVKDEAKESMIVPVENVMYLTNYISNEEYTNKIKLFFSELPSADKNVNGAKYCSIHYKKNKEFKNEDFQTYFESILDLLKKIKKNEIINKELGVTYFYDELFKVNNIKIFGINLRNKLYFTIRKLLLKSGSDNLKQIYENYISKLNIYDLSLISKEKKINLYFEYLKLKEQNLNLTITQRLHMIIQNNKLLKNDENLMNYKNRFFLDEKDKTQEKPFYLLKKEIFYNKIDEIFNILKCETDFTITCSFENHEYIQINFIYSNKFNELNNIVEKLNSLDNNINI